MFIIRTLEKLSQTGILILWNHTYTDLHTPLNTLTAMTHTADHHAGLCPRPFLSRFIRLLLFDIKHRPILLWNILWCHHPEGSSSVNPTNHFHWALSAGASWILGSEPIKEWPTGSGQCGEPGVLLRMIIVTVTHCIWMASESPHG